jgi:hypothetical protein
MWSLEIEKAPVENHILTRPEVMIAECRVAIETVNLLMRRACEQTDVYGV